MYNTAGNTQTEAITTFGVWEGGRYSGSGGKILMILSSSNYVHIYTCKGPKGPLKFS
jgi:hypothetical protein